VRKLILTGVTLAFGFALTAVAEAKTFYFDGSPTHDNGATIQFTVKGVAQKGKFVPHQVSSVHVYNQLFTCYTAAGAPATSGRLEGSVDDYGYPGMKPILVKKNGSFTGSLTDKITDPGTGKKVIVTELKFAGRIVNKRATGTYQSKSDPEGGIDFGYCGDKTPVKWRAARSALPPLPPGDN
jgi:hypothetical protein